MVIWNAYRILYTLPPLFTALQRALRSGRLAWRPSLCTMLATLAACMESLHEQPGRG